MLSNYLLTESKVLTRKISDRDLDLLTERKRSLSFFLTVPLCAQVHNWVLANINAESDPAMEQHHIHGKKIILLVD